MLILGTPHLEIFAFKNIVLLFYVSSSTVKLHMPCEENQRMFVCECVFAVVPAIVIVWGGDYDHTPLADFLHL